MATVSSAPRTATFTTVSTTAGPFNITFRLFDTDSLDVYVDGTRTTAYTVSATFSNGFTDSATLTLTTAVPSGTAIIIDGALTPRREEDYLASDPGLTAKLNIELPRIWSALAEVKRDTERSFRTLQAVDPNDFTLLPKLPSGPSVATDQTRLTPASFGALPRGSDGGADQSAAVQAAMNYCAAAGVPLYFDAMYLCNGLTQVSNLTCIGIGGGIVSLATASSTIAGMPSTGQHVVTADAKTNFVWDGVIFDNSGDTRFVSGMRTIIAYDCTDFEVRNCRFITQGAALAAVKSSRYAARDNTVFVQGNYEVSTVPTARHDGIFDQWDGSNNFQITGNTIRAGNTTGAWPILITGEDTTGGGSRVYNGQITGNRIVGYVRVGIHVMGRDGGADNFIVSGNAIYGNAQSLTHGIYVSEATGCVVDGNIVVDAALNGIRVATENLIYAPDQNAVTVTGNVVMNANVLASTDQTNGSAIAVNTDGTNIFIGGNCVVGAAHRYGLIVDGSGTGEDNVIVGPNALQAGVVGSTAFFGAPSASGGLVVDGAEATIWAAGLQRLRTTTTTLEQRGTTTESQSLLVGLGRTGNGASQAVFYADGAGQQSLAVAAFSGANGVREVRARGTGGLQMITNDAAPVIIGTNNTTRFLVGSDGVVQFGTRTSSSDVPITGYIEIKDLGGTVRRLAVIG